MSLRQLTDELLRFRDERNWAQFHTLRHLIVSLNLEAAELLELTQLINKYGVTQVQIRRCGVESGLNPQRLTALEFLNQFRLDQYLFGTTFD